MAIILAILGKQRFWQEIQNLYEVCDFESEKSTQMYSVEWTPLCYSPFAWIVGWTNLAKPYSNWGGQIIPIYYYWHPQCFSSSGITVEGVWRPNERGYQYALYPTWSLDIKNIQFMLVKSLKSSQRFLESADEVVKRWQKTFWSVKKNHFGHLKLAIFQNVLIK